MKNIILSLILLFSSVQIQAQDDLKIKGSETFMYILNLPEGKFSGTYTGEFGNAKIEKEKVKTPQGNGTFKGILISGNAEKKSQIAGNAKRTKLSNEKNTINVDLKETDEFEVQTAFKFESYRQDIEHAKLFACKKDGENYYFIRIIQYSAPTRTQDNSVAGKLLDKAFDKAFMKNIEVGYVMEGKTYDTKVQRDLSYAKYHSMEIKRTGNEISFLIDNELIEKMEFKGIFGSSFERIGDGTQVNFDEINVTRHYYVSDKEIQYNGQWSSGTLNGKGKLYLGNYSYEGDFLNNKKHGNGYYLFGNSKGEKIPTNTVTFYKGEFRNDTAVGMAEAQYQNRGYYKGSVLNWVPNGNGSLDFNTNHGMFGKREKDLRVKYEGNFAQGKISGNGKLTGNNGDEFQGNWTESEWNVLSFTGKGTMHLENGSQYSGDFTDGKFNGNGKFTFSNQSPLIGNWKMGSFNGEGKVFGDEFVFEGSIYSFNPVNKILNGKGKINYKDSSSFEGDIMNNRVEKGIGKKYYYSKDQESGNKIVDVVEGAFANNLPNGKVKWTRTYFDEKGILIPEIKLVYNGEMLDGKMHGTGANTYEKTQYGSSEIYVGDFVNGLRSSNGKLTNSEPEVAGNISIYEGQWLNDKQHGTGKETNTSAYGEFISTGTWKEGMMEGYGEYSGKENNLETQKSIPFSYKGYFTKGNKNGEGTEVGPEGTYSGNWTDNQKYGFGKMNYKDGRVYEGNWVNDLPNGKGIMTLANKQVLNGKFIDGEYQKEYACKSINIGNQIWMQENLNVATFRNGDAIPQAKSFAEWANATSKKQPVWCYYEFNDANGAKYGKLYNWHAVNDPRGLAPNGWHIPSSKEFLDLFNNFRENGLEMDRSRTWEDRTWSDGRAKLKSKSGWNENGNNESGFNGLPAGMLDFSWDRAYTKQGSFWGKGEITYFWTSVCCIDFESSASALQLDKYTCSLGSNNNKDHGFSVRCVKDK